MKCRICGCTDKIGCPAGCYWVEPRLCSCCATLKERMKDYEVSAGTLDLSILSKLLREVFCINRSVKRKQKKTQTKK